MEELSSRPAVYTHLNPISIPKRAPGDRLAAGWWTMRRSMFKAIVERPRLGGGYVRKGRPPRELDDHPAHKGMRQPYGYQSKSLNENLSPLRRFLVRQVGRPWDKVYSEICEHLRPDSTVQDHVRLHIEDFVSTHVAVGEDGTLEHRGGGRIGRIVTLLYVDPRTGILRLNKAHPRVGGRRRSAPPSGKRYPHVVVGPEQELIQVGGIWYWVTFDTVPPPTVRVSIDPVTGTERRKYQPNPCVDILMDETVAQGRYRAGKRQACARDLSRHKLANDHDEGGRRARP